MSRDLERTQVIDAHNHVAPEPVPSMGTTQVKITAEELIQQMQVAGVDKAVIFGAGPVIKPTMNKQIAEARRKYPDKFIAFARVNPYDGQSAIDEVTDMVRNYGMKGLKLHPGFQSFKIDSVFTVKLLEGIAGLHIPVLFHIGEPPHLCHPAQAETIADRFPDVPIILGHTGEMYLGMDCIKAAKKFDNVFLESSWCPKVTMELALLEVGADRMIMGTDTPYNDFRMELLKINLIKMDDEDRSKLKGKNIARLLKL